LRYFAEQLHKVGNFGGLALPVFGGKGEHRQMLHTEVARPLGALDKRVETAPVPFHFWQIVISGPAAVAV